MTRRTFFPNLVMALCVTGDIWLWRNVDWTYAVLGAMCALVTIINWWVAVTEDIERESKQ